MSDKSDSNEIDLQELFIRIGNGLKALVVGLLRLFLKSILFLFRKWLILLISVVLGIGASLLVNTLVKPFFSSELIVRSNSIPNSEMIQYINRLNKFCNKDDYSALAESLGIEEARSVDIYDIEAFWLIDLGNDLSPDYIDYKNTHNVLDSINVRLDDRLAIRLRTRTPEFFDVLKDGIIYYIESNDFFAARNDIRLKQLQEDLDRVLHDVERLDSLQKVKYFEETRNRKPDGAGQMIFMQEQNTQLVYENIYELFDIKHALEIEKSLYGSISTIMGDYETSFSEVNGFRYYAIYIVPGFLVIGLLITIITSSKRRYWNSSRGNICL